MRGKVHFGGTYRTACGTNSSWRSRGLETTAYKFTTDPDDVTCKKCAATYEVRSAQQLKDKA